MKDRNIPTIGMILVTLGIIFGTDRLIGYALIGTGEAVSILQWLRSKTRGNGH